MKRLTQRILYDAATDGGSGGAGDGGSGDAGAGSSSSTDAGATGNAGGATQPEKTFTQAEMTNIATREKEQGKRAAQEEVAKALGVSVEEATTIIADAKKRGDAEKSEAQLAREAADRATAEAETAKAEATRERHAARVERALASAGVTDEKKIVRLGRLIDVEPGAELEDITSAVKALQAEMPELFGRPVSPNGDPPGKPPGKGTKDESAMERGMKRGRDRAAVGSGLGGYDLPDPSAVQT